MAVRRLKAETLSSAESRLSHGRQGVTQHTVRQIAIFSAESVTGDMGPVAEPKGLEPATPGIYEFRASVPIPDASDRSPV